MADARPVVEVTAKQRPPLPKFPIVGAVVGLVLLVIGGVLFLVPQQGSTLDESSDYVDLAARATEFATQDNTYDATDPDEYQQRLSGLSTSDFLTQHLAEIPFAELSKIKEISSNPTVKSVAIRDIDGDSAEVLMAVDATINNAELEAPVLYQMRWVVSMTKSSGEWLVNGVETVGAESVMAGASGDGDQ